MEGPVLPISRYKKEEKGQAKAPTSRLPSGDGKSLSLTNFRSFRPDPPQLPVTLRLTVHSNWARTGNIILSLGKIQPS